MSRLTECAALRTSTGGLPCSVGEARSRLDPESAARAYLEGHQDDALTSLGALTQRLSRTSGFLDARAASVASARSLLRTRPAAERETKVAAVATFRNWRFSADSPARQK